MIQWFAYMTQNNDPAGDLINVTLTLPTPPPSMLAQHPTPKSQAQRAPAPIGRVIKPFPSTSRSRIAANMVPASHQRLVSSAISIDTPVQSAMTVPMFHESLMEEGQHFHRAEVISPESHGLMVQTPQMPFTAPLPIRHFGETVTLELEENPHEQDAVPAPDSTVVPAHAYSQCDEDADEVKRGVKRSRSLESEEFGGPT